MARVGHPTMQKSPPALPALSFNPFGDGGRFGRWPRDVEDGEGTNRAQPCSPSPRGDVQPNEVMG